MSSGAFVSNHKLLTWLSCPSRRLSLCAYNQRLTECAPLYIKYDTRCSINIPTDQKKSQLVTLSTGVDLEVIRENPNNVNDVSDKPPIVFIHGSKHGAWCFRFFQPFFAEKSFTSYALSLRGLGKSTIHHENDTPNGKLASFPMEQYVADLEAFFKCMNFSAPPIIIGHSAGGFIVQKWALQNAEKFSGLVLLASSPPSGNSKLVRRVFFKRGIRTTWQVTRALITNALTSDLELCREVFFSSVDVPEFDPAVEGDDIIRSYMPLFGQISARIDTRSWKPLQQPDVLPNRPMLAIGGSEDLIVDEEAVRETASFWNGDSIIIDRAPHDIMLYSRWRHVANLINDWIEKKVKKSSTAFS